MQENTGHHIDPRVLRERFMTSLFSIWICSICTRQLLTSCPGKIYLSDRRIVL